MSNLDLMMFKLQTADGRRRRKEKKPSTSDEVASTSDENNILSGSMECNH